MKPIFIFVKNASGTAVPISVSPGLSMRVSGRVRKAKIVSTLAKQTRNPTAIARQELTSEERSSPRWEVKGIRASSTRPSGWLLFTLLRGLSFARRRRGIGVFRQEGIVARRRLGR